MKDNRSTLDIAEVAERWAREERMPLAGILHILAEGVASTGNKADEILCAAVSPLWGHPKAFLTQPEDWSLQTAKWRKVDPAQRYPQGLQQYLPRHSFALRSKAGLRGAKKPGAEWLLPLPSQCLDRFGDFDRFKLRELYSKDGGPPPWAERAISILWGTADSLGWKTPEENLYWCKFVGEMLAGLPDDLLREFSFRRDNFERWCQDSGYPLPKFWFPEVEEDSGPSLGKALKEKQNEESGYTELERSVGGMADKINELIKKNVAEYEVPKEGLVYHTWAIDDFLKDYTDQAFADKFKKTGKERDMLLKSVRERLEGFAYPKRAPRRK
jgi:hypothetical protein